ncbi:uncharacterized protein CCOS01_01012 [Colletotrichum costaricense]|uniref:Uncharacterized protein n=2 Tax=Colletotrichum acutatum species complex TaxID=2707335 RepID=A0AAI9ZA53_9PEZI|nr:uncharacterized protein CCOS01_01012 [Colletotrichum costaricense]XP_060385001.1 uncharacterized protein CTAM01_04326 [Colletotrichum tamarilloi]KAK1504096.1 hypothetical protein CTAM01_04326 [Colletotrichum tamarilloi]KAK1539698.1 hypothetical protein CCOS01_01012 [Colletotrichum costaricense]
MTRNLGDGRQKVVVSLREPMRCASSSKEGQGVTGPVRAVRGSMVDRPGRGLVGQAGGKPSAHGTRFNERRDGSMPARSRWKFAVSPLEHPPDRYIQQGMLPPRTLVCDEVCDLDGDAL